MLLPLALFHFFFLMTEGLDNFELVFFTHYYYWKYVCVQRLSHCVIFHNSTDFFDFIIIQITGFELFHTLEAVYHTLR